MDPAPEKLARYLDLGLYASGDGVPFTQSSNLVYALKASLENTDWDEKIARVRRLHDRVRPRLAELGATFKMPAEHSSPAVITLPMPDGVNSLEVADRLESAGFLLSCRSAYLSTRNWLQDCMMGDLSENAEYHFAKEENRSIQHELATLEKKLKNASVVSTDNVPEDVVFLGHTVKLLDLDDDSEQLVRIVGEAGAPNANDEVMSVSVNSPMGEALMKARVGDKVKVKAPRGTMEFKILEIVQ